MLLLLQLFPTSLNISAPWPQPKILRWPAASVSASVHVRSLPHAGFLCQATLSSVTALHELHLSFPDGVAGFYSFQQKKWRLFWQASYPELNNRKNISLVHRTWCVTVLYSGFEYSYRCSGKNSEAHVSILHRSKNHSEIWLRFSRHLAIVFNTRYRYRRNS